MSSLAPGLYLLSLLIVLNPSLRYNGLVFNVVPVRRQRRYSSILHSLVGCPNIWGCLVCNSRNCELSLPLRLHFSCHNGRRSNEAVPSNHNSYILDPEHHLLGQASSLQDPHFQVLDHHHRSFPRHHLHLRRNLCLSLNRPSPDC